MNSRNFNIVYNVERAEANRRTVAIQTMPAQQRPSSAHQRPGLAHQRPRSAQQSPSSIHQRSAAAHRSPISIHQRPGAARQRPGPAHQSPRSIIQRPGHAHQSPRSIIQRPDSAHQSPRSIIQRPDSAHQSPRSIIQRLDSAHQSPRSIIQRPDSAHQSPRSIIQRLDSAHQSPRSIIQRPDSAHQSTSSACQRPGSAQNPVSFNTQLMELNHYALLQVCRSITNFKDQLAFAQTCDQIRQIFTHHIWNRGEPACEIGPTTELFFNPRYAKDFSFYLQSMRNQFTYFCSHDIEQMPCKFNGLLNILRGHGISSFPSVKMCILEGKGGMDETDLQELSNVLPKLKAIIIFKLPLRGLYLPRFIHLEEIFLIDVPIDGGILARVIDALKKLRILDVRSCASLRFPDFKSDSLEVVRLHVHTIRNILMQVLNLPKLKTLELRYCDRLYKIPQSVQFNYGTQSGFYPFRFLLPTILIHKAPQITSININNNAMQLPADWDNRLDPINLCNLEKLIFNNWHHEEIFMGRHITSKSKLKTFSCGDWSKLSLNRITDILTSFKNLKMFELSNFNLDSSTLYRIAQVLRYEGRIEPLNVWNWSQIKHRLSNDQMDYWMQQRLLNLYLKPNSEPSLREFRRDLWGFEIEFDNSL